MTGHDLVRQYFPDATDEECDFILWEKTGWPEFFDPEIGAEVYFGQQIAEYKASLNEPR